MKSLREQFKDAAKGVALSKNEKNRMREELVKYMEYKPIRKNRSTEKKATHFLHFPYFKAHHFTGALLIAVLITTSTFGVTFAADNALPGDLLYNVKVNINEEIKIALIFSPKSRIAWKQERAERRLVEASQLAAEGRLDEKNKEKISQLFVKQSEEIVEEIRAIESKNPVLAAEVSSEFENSLDTHEAVLASFIVEQEDDANEDSRQLVEKVRTASMEVEKIRKDAEHKIVTEEDEENEKITEDPDNESNNEPNTNEKVESANMRIRVVQRAHSRAEELHMLALEQLAQLEMETTLIEKVEAQITFGESKMEDGAQAFLTHDYNDAYRNYRQATASFQKVIQTLELAKLFSVEIYSKVSFNEEKSENENEDATPDDIDEQLVEIETLHTSVKQAIKDVQALLLTQGGYDTETLDESHTRIKDANTYMLRGEIALVLGDYDDARNLLERAHRFASETVQTLEKASKSDAVKDVMPEPETPSKEDVSEEAPVTLLHDFRDRTHTYTIHIDTPTPCHSVNDTVTVTESSPEQITINIEIIPPQEEGQVCAQVIDTKEYVVTATGSNEATLTKVTVDGTEVPWEVSEVKSETTDTSLEPKDEDDKENTEDDKENTTNINPQSQEE